MTGDGALINDIEYRPMMTKEVRLTEEVSMKKSEKEISQVN